MSELWLEKAADKAEHEEQSEGCVGEDVWEPVDRKSKL